MSENIVNLKEPGVQVIKKKNNIKKGQIYLRWLKGGPVTPFEVLEVSEKSFTLWQLGIANETTMDIDMLELYIEQGDVKKVYEPVG